MFSPTVTNRSPHPPAFVIFCLLILNFHFYYYLLFTYLFTNLLCAQEYKHEGRLLGTFHDVGPGDLILRSQSLTVSTFTH